MSFCFQLDLDLVIAVVVVRIIDISTCLFLCFLIFSTFLQEENEPDDKYSNKSDNANGEIENVRVVVRVRPMDKIEIDGGNESVVKIDKLNRCVTVLKPNAAVGEPPKIYYFDNVYAEDSSQVRIYFHFFFHRQHQIWCFYHFCLMHFEVIWH